MTQSPYPIKSILIADDSGTARMIIKKCFEIAGLGDSCFFEAANGQEALSILQDKRVDLLVTDLNMPVLDGKGLLARLKSIPGLAGVPVMVITSGSNPANEKELINLGAALVLSKPISPASVVRACGNLNACNSGVRP